MIDAPEWIALRWKLGVAVTSGPMMEHPDYTQYIRADAVDAMLAAERKACAVAVEASGLPFQGDNADLADAIRKRGAK